MRVRVLRPNHLRHPLRPIVKREKQNGKWYVVLECQHAMPGRPASRQSRFFPCALCYQEIRRTIKAR